MYDVRGIQDYIFKTNYAKEVVGASELVDSIIVDGLNEYIEALEKEERNNYMTDWKNDPHNEFLENENIVMQVMYIGGGNAYVLFRDKNKEGKESEKEVEEIYHAVNRFLGKYVLEKTYSLNLAVAVCEKSDLYAEDYKNVNEKMREIKAKMPNAKPMGALPFMARDSITGYPISDIRKEHDEKKRYCTEALLKRDNFPKDESEKVFDNMVTQKGDDSNLAICHIDGNSMGLMIKNTMENVKSYSDAISKMRTLSTDIDTSFSKIFDKMVEYMEWLTPKVKKDAKHKLYRKIIVAGDDITFICNARLARSAVEFFLESIVKEGYSACAGIAYFNSHFPFSDAYKVAEECCGSAKKRAKEVEHRGEKDSIGCYMDFQICTNVRAANLGAYRKKHYTTKDGEGQFIARPYYVPSKTEREKLNQKNEVYSINHLKEWLQKFNDEKFMARNKAKKLTNVIPEGLHGIKMYLQFLKYRGVFMDNPEEQYRYWYDALEIMDIDLILKEGEADEDKEFKNSLIK